MLKACQVQGRQDVGAVTLGRKPICMNIISKKAKLRCKSDSQYLHIQSSCRLLLLHSGTSDIVSWVLGKRNSNGCARKQEHQRCRLHSGDSQPSPSGSEHTSWEPTIPQVRVCLLLPFRTDKSPSPSRKGALTSLDRMGNSLLPCTLGIHCDTASLEKHSRWKHGSPSLPVPRLLLEGGNMWDRIARWGEGKPSTHLGSPLRCFSAGPYAAKPQLGACDPSDFTHKTQNRK